MDLTGWLKYFTRGLASQLVEVRNRGQAAIRTDLLAREHGLNARQADVLALIAAEPGASISDLEQRVPGADRRTLQRDLRRMLDLGLIAHSGSATDPARAYRIDPANGIDEL